MSENQGLLSESRPSPPSSGKSAAPSAVYHDSSQSPVSRTLQLLFVSLIVIMVLVTLFLSVYKGLESGSATYFLLGVSLIGFVIVEILMIVFTRRGDLPKGKSWFLYLVGFCVLLESVFTNVLLFSK